MDVVPISGTIEAILLAAMWYMDKLIGIALGFPGKIPLFVLRGHTCCSGFAAPRTSPLNV